ncbi:MAG: TetR/AcrR family transcriptional regulator, partial [Acidimicrobiales bacterium]
VEAAAQVFARRGFHGASLDEIAEGAGFTRGAIYSNFGGKEDLFLAVLDHHNATTLDAFSAAFDRAGGVGVVGAAETAALWHEIMVPDRDWLALTLEFRLYALRNPEVKERFAAWARSSQEGVARFIQEMVAGAGLELSIPVTDLAAIVDAASGALQELAYLDPSKTRVFESFIQLIIDASPSGQAPLSQ